MEYILEGKELNIYNLFIQGNIANLEEPEGLYLYLIFVYKNKCYNIILDLFCKIFYNYWLLGYDKEKFIKDFIKEI